MTVNSQIFEGLSEAEQTQALTLFARMRHGAAGVRSRPLAELLAREFEPLQFLVEPMLARGHLAMLGGRPKSGKSWLVLQLAQAVDRGEPFLGRPTRRGKVLYVALEDGERRIHQRCRLLKWEPQQAEVLFDLARFDWEEGRPGPGLGQIEQASWAFDLIIIDTLIATLSGRISENDNAAMGAIVNELARIAHTGEKTILLVHHTNKGMADDVFTLLRGASALRGAYDVGLLLERKLNEREAVLHLESRDVELSSMTIRQAANGVGWEAVGSGSELKRIRAGRRVVEALSSLGDGATAEEIAEYLDVSRQAVHRQLEYAERDGLVRREEKVRETGGRPASGWVLVEERGEWRFGQGSGGAEEIRDWEIGEGG